MKSKQKKIKHKTAEPSRQVYEKPRLRTIELVTEEVLAVGCKVSDATKNSGADFTTCVVSNAPCTSAGQLGS
jgi:hypothetical protein